MITTRFDAKSEMANAPILQRHLYHNHQHACEPLRLDNMERTTEHMSVNFICYHSLKVGRYLHLADTPPPKGFPMDGQFAAFKVLSGNVELARGRSGIAGSWFRSRIQMCISQ